MPVHCCPSWPCPICNTAAHTPVFKSITDFSDAELRNELHRRAMIFLGDQTQGVSIPPAQSGGGK